MDNTISAQEINRHGISAVDETLKNGPVYVIHRNRPRYVILSGDEYQRLSCSAQSQAALWEKLLDASTSEGRSKSEIDQQLAEERGRPSKPSL